MSASPSPAPTTITIGGVDKSTLVSLKSIRINDYITQRINTCIFELITTNTYTPELGMEVIIEDDFVILFGGYIVNRESERVDSTHIKYRLSCQDYSLLLMHKLVTETYEDKTCLYIINDLITDYCSGYGITQTNVAIGTTLDRIQFNYINVFDSLKKICRYTGYDFYIDYAKDIHFFLASGNAATFDITDANGYAKDLIVERDLMQVRNTIYVRGATYLSESYTQNELGDGIKTDFPTTYKAHNITVKVDGASKSVGTDYIHSFDDYDCLINFEQKMLKFGSAPANGTAIVFTYTYDIPIFIVNKDTDSINALMALGDVDGIREFMIKDTLIKTKAEARTRADAELTRRANPKYTANYETYRTGLVSGMIQNIDSDLLGVDQNMVITEVTTYIGYSGHHKYIVKLEGRLYGLIELLAEMLALTRDTVDRDEESLDKILSYVEGNIEVTEGVPTFTEHSGTYVYDDATSKYDFAQYS